ncbi:MAG: Restriction endonuclease subunit [Pedosphaera sp.]|nr:Restriction endonuclease subunit [Pedosphaera sp.]
MSIDSPDRQMLSPLGIIPDGWRLVHLKDVADKVRSGATPRGGESNYLASREKFALIRSQNVFDRHFDETGLAFISEEQAAELGGAEAQVGDALLNITGDGITFARSTLVPKRVLPACVNQHVMLIRPRSSECASGFLLSYLTHPRIKEYIESFNAGGSRRAITKGNIESFVIPLPPLPEQRAIASVLGSLDDKIELNRRMNETLEALAQSVFKSWFVDFDSVRANGGHFQDSAIGPIPKGWKVERFDKHITADRGLSYKGEGLRDDGTGLPMHNLNSVYEGGGYKHEGIKYYAGEYREKHLLQPGDMIVTNTEQGFDHLLIGHAAIVPKRYGPKGLFSHHIYRVRHKPSSPFSPHYLVELFNNPRWHYWISGFSNGTTINMLPKDALEMPLLVVPPDELVNKFTALAASVHKQVEANLEQSRTLAALRDALLPKLLSGELRVACSKEVQNG